MEIVKSHQEKEENTESVIKEVEETDEASEEVIMLQGQDLDLIIIEIIEIGAHLGLLDAICNQPKKIEMLINNQQLVDRIAQD